MNKVIILAALLISSATFATSVYGPMKNTGTIIGTQAAIISEALASVPKDAHGAVVTSKGVIFCEKTPMKGPNSFLDVCNIFSFE